MRNTFPALAIGLASILSTAILSAPAHAEDKKAAPIHVRGSIVDYQGSTLKVKTREGETMDVALADDWKLQASRMPRSPTSSRAILSALHPYQRPMVAMAHLRS